jgi:hypothetical protein
LEGKDISHAEEESSGYQTGPGPSWPKFSGSK